MRRYYPQFGRRLSTLSTATRLFIHSLSASYPPPLPAPATEHSLICELLSILWADWERGRPARFRRDHAKWCAKRRGCRHARCLPPPGRRAGPSRRPDRHLRRQLDQPVADRRAGPHAGPGERDPWRPDLEFATRRGRAGRRPGNADRPAAHLTHDSRGLESGRPMAPLLSPAHAAHTPPVA